MATTSPDNLRTPNPTDPYNLVADLAILAGDVQSALALRANRYIGSSAQMNAFAAPDGTEWYNTTDKSGYLRLGGAWKPWKPWHDGAGDTDWVSLPYASGITAGSTQGSSRLEYAVRGGVVYIRGGGSPTSGSFTRETTISTLPSHLTPDITVYGKATGQGGRDASMLVLSDGSIRFYPSPNNNTGLTWCAGAVSYPV